MKKFNFLFFSIFVICGISSGTNAAVKVNKTEFTKGNFNPYKHPKSLAKFVGDKSKVTRSTGSLKSYRQAPPASLPKLSPRIREIETTQRIYKPTKTITITPVKREIVEPKTTRYTPKRYESDFEEAKLVRAPRIETNNIDLLPTKELVAAREPEILVPQQQPAQQVQIQQPVIAQQQVTTQYDPNLRRPVNTGIIGQQPVVQSMQNFQGRYQNPYAMQPQAQQQIYATQAIPAQQQFQAAPYTGFNQQFVQPNQNMNIPVENAGTPQLPLYSGEELPSQEVNKLGIKVTPKVGTQGIGLEVGTKITDQIVFRAGGNYLEYSDDDRVNEIDYEYDANVLNANALLDIHPFTNGFRITGGAYFAPDILEFKATPNSAATIGDTSYTPSEIGSIQGKIKTKNISPYAGIGYSSAFTEAGDWFVDADLGVKFNNIDTSATSNGSLANDATFIADLNREKTKIQDNFDFLKYYPVINLGIGYKF